MERRLDCAPTAPTAQAMLKRSIPSYLSLVQRAFTVPRARSPHIYVLWAPLALLALFLQLHALHAFRALTALLGLLPRSNAPLAHTAPQEQRRVTTRRPLARQGRFQATLHLAPCVQRAHSAKSAHCRAPLPLTHVLLGHTRPPQPPA